MHPTARARSDCEQPHAPLVGALLDGVQDQMAILRDRELGRDIGCCERCGTAIRSQQNFIRSGGAITHLRCRITHRAPDRVPKGAVIAAVRAAVAARRGSAS